MAPVPPLPADAKAAAEKMTFSQAAENADKKEEKNRQARTQEAKQANPDVPWYAKTRTPSPSDGDKGGANRQPHPWWEQYSMQGTCDRAAANGPAGRADIQCT